MIATRTRENGFTATDVNSRDYAREQLFGGRVSSASMERFNNNHNTTAFNSLVQSNYSGAAAVETKPAEPQFASYIPVTPTYTNPLSTKAPAETAEPMAETKQEVQPIFNPYSSPYYEPKTDVKWSLEINPVTNEVTSEKQTASVAEIVKAKLNTRGIVMAATYALVVILLAVLLIVNTVNIQASESNIRNYENQIASLTSSIGALESARADAMNVEKLQDEAAAAGFTDEVNVVVVQRPPLTTATNSDYSTNWFDQIVKFFQRLFGAA